MALAASTPLESLADGAESLEGVIKTSGVVYKGAYVSALGPSAASGNGRVTNLALANGEIPMGHSDSAGPASSTYPGGAPLTGVSGGTVKGKIAKGLRPLKVAVVGAAAATDNWKPVWASDDGTYTLTAQKGPPLGYVYRWISSTTCYVQFFSFESLMSKAIDEPIILPLGAFNCADMANGDVLTDAPLFFHGEIIKFFATVKKAPAGTGGTATLNLEINTTNVGPTTATSIVVATGNAKGLVTQSAAISANNVFHTGDTISVEAATVTTMSAGMFDLFVVVRKRWGI